MDISRRQFTAYTLGSLILPAVPGCMGEKEKSGDSPTTSEASIEAKEDLSSLEIPTREFIYDVEITHNDIHDLEFTGEEVFKHLKRYHSDRVAIVACFIAAYQAAYDFHTHMHSPFEEDWARTREALDVLRPAYVRLDEVTRDTELRDYYKTLDDYYYNLQLGVDPDFTG